MVADNDAPGPDQVLAAFGIEGTATAMTPVRGAWSNRVYRVDAGKHSFAVKEMRNPWADPNWSHWLAESWAFERHALAAGVAAPRPVPNPADGGCLAWVPRRDPALSDRVPVRLHRWVDGRQVAPAPVTPQIAGWAGQVLALLHGMKIRPTDRSLFPVLNFDTADRWPELADAAHWHGATAGHQQCATWADLMDTVRPCVALMADLARSAGQLPEEEVLTHGDVDQKNLIVSSDGPVLCDWDLAAPLVPRRELADVALSLAGTEAAEIAREVVRSYRRAGGDDTDIDTVDLGPSMMTGLDWVAFNVERAIGARPASRAETALAHELLPGLLAAIPRQLEKAEGVRDFLRL
ncbi:MAG TPA: aminoglycoside phosphotransferase family protein [Streptosporangiaceae bacterium]|nr:aminoglycoside phosphotransferase family protein [Streptosporangiaceae bacterium]